jgi:hypothetical protein
MLRPLTKDELTDKFTEVPLFDDEPKANRPRLSRARARMARLARFISSVWGWLCC